jgi:hypothetical protein
VPSFTLKKALGRWQSTQAGPESLLSGNFRNPVVKGLDLGASRCQGRKPRQTGSRDQRRKRINAMENRKEMNVSQKAVIGVYDSLAKAERAELHLGDVHLPVGQEYLVSGDMEARQVHGNITARGVAKALAEAGVPFAKERIAEYEEALEAGKLLLVFHGDEEMVAKAYHALGNTDNDELTVLGD